MQALNATREALINAITKKSSNMPTEALYSLAPEMVPLSLPQAKHVVDIEIIDMDSNLPVDISIYKCSETNAMFALDSSYILTLSEDEPILNPITGLWVKTLGD